MENNDIYGIKQAFMHIFPDGEVSQLQVSHPADDNGIWFFSRKTSLVELQLESTTGTYPFLIESSGHNKRIVANSCEEVLNILRTELG